MLKFYLIAALISIVMSVGSGFYFHGKGDATGAARIKAEWNAADLAEAIATAEEKKKDQAAADRNDEMAAQMIADLTRKVTEQQKRIANEIAKNSVYRTCILPADGMRLYNQNRIRSGKN